MEMTHPGLTRQKMFYWLGRRFVAQIRRNLHFDLRSHLPQLPVGPKVFAANHPTTLDPFYMLTFFAEEIRMMVNAEVFKVQPLGFLINKGGHIPVDKNNGRDSFDRACGHLHTGGNIGIFPEGDLSPGDKQQLKLAELHTGAVRLAMTSGAALLPVGIAVNVDKIKFLKFRFRKELEPARFYFRGDYAVTVGEPLQLHGDVDDHTQVREHTGVLMDQIAALSAISAARIG